MGEAVVEALVDGDLDIEETTTSSQCVICYERSSNAQLVFCGYCDRSYAKIIIKLSY